MWGKCGVRAAWIYREKLYFAQNNTSILNTHYENVIILTFSDNREELVCKRRHYLDGGDKLSSPEEKGKGKRKKLKNGRYSDDDEDDVVSLVGN